jgi:hypothetical protein
VFVHPDLWERRATINARMQRPDLRRLRVALTREKRVDNVIDNELDKQRERWDGRDA